MLIMRDMAEEIKHNLFMGMGHYVGASADPETSDHLQLAYKHHLTAYQGDYYPTDAKYRLRLEGHVSYLGLEEQWAPRPRHASTIGRQLRTEDFHYAVMSFDGTKVLLQAGYNKRSEEYGPKKSCPSPAGGTRAVLPQPKAAGQGSMPIVPCVPARH